MSVLTTITEKLAFLSLKKVWIPLVTIPLVGVGVFYGMTYYEHQNDCRISISSDFPFLECSYYFNFQGHCESDFGCTASEKPLILLYPEQDTHVNVSLEYTPGFSATYPAYNTSLRGWSVLAHPDGTLLNKGTNQDTYGLFWEGNPSINDYDLSRGFVVKGSELRDFLFEKLTTIGLNTKEKSDFIMYWYPKLQEYPYLQITFAGKDYTNRAKLKITPTPDSLLRVFMVAKPLPEYKSVPEQTLQAFERKGFSVVEWGGTIVE